MSERTQRADERRERLAFLKGLGEVRTPVKRGLAQALEASLVKELECAAALGTTPPELVAALAQAELEAYGECLTSECLVSTMACGARPGARPLLGELYTIAEPVAREASKRGRPRWPTPSTTRSALRTIIIVLPLTFRTYQILAHTNIYFHCLHSYLDLLQ